MSESSQNGYPDVAKDEYVSMVARKHISDLAAEPVNFNVEGQLMALQLLTPALSENDYILDIGCNSGEFVLEAAEITHMPARMIGLDVNEYPYSTYLSPDLDLSRFVFMQGDGQDMQLPDNAVRAAFAHNTIYRARNVLEMFAEMKRVVEPGGLIGVSTNARGHAPKRHRFERMAQLYVEAHSGIEIPLSDDPAQKCYFEDLRMILAMSGGLVPLGRPVTQNSYSVITADRVLDYELAIELSTAANSIPPELATLWRTGVEKIVGPTIRAEIAAKQQAVNEEHARGMQRTPFVQQADQGPPLAFYADPVVRGMLILRNDKAA